MSRPVFRLVPPDVDVNEGQTVRLEYTLSGRPKPEIVWRLGDVLVKQDANHKVRAQCENVLRSHSRQPAT